MAARVILVHNKPSLIEQVAPALTVAGYEVAVFADPMPALKALEAANADVLVTSLEFGIERQNGLSLARMTLRKQPSIKVLFVGLPKLAHHTRGFGEFLPIPFTAADLVESVNRLLASGE
jgi:DNA-binding NtrC family response regulator